ncbi:filamentous hemagglutinin N-terminal domain-containing protein [Microcoleus sp. FACHB-SPT15]|nr:filamentous hemagglutinin N-terminal domain-containing protein [Microcoleus sp. FACHB-SPT15]
MTDIATISINKSFEAKGMENLTIPAQRRCPSWRFGMVLAFGIVGASTSIGTPSLAQVTPDTTLGAEGSVVVPNVIPNANIDLIEGGATRDINLFHSFSEFNVGDGQRVYFANPIGIENILTRVTGNNLSNILGTLGVDGSANLFLLNPNGIIFGQNARLDVGGSFVATTADSLVFGDGLEFSATNPAVPSLLTVSVPLGLQYGLQPGAIASQGILFVDEGQSLILAGGNITLDDSFLAVDFFEGGRVELGAVAGEGTVGLNAEGNLLSLSFPNELERANVSLTNGSLVDVSAEDGGSIAIHAQNIGISAGSRLIAGIASGLGSPESQAGSIILDATGEIRVDRSIIYNLLFPGATGTSGNIEITTGSLAVTNRAQLSASTLGQGNAGSVMITASDNISFDDSSALSVVEDGAVGRGGNIEITTGSLLLTNGGQLDASIFEGGQGDAGDVLVNARDTVSLDGTSADGVRASTLFSEVVEGGVGNGGNVIVTTGSLIATNGGRLEASTEGEGNAGNVIVNARDIVQFDGTSQDGRLSSGALSNVVGDAVGNAGNVEITTGSLFVTNGAQLDSSTEGQGNSGSIIINARDQVTFQGVSADGEYGSAAFSRLEERAVGDGGNIEITARMLSVTDGAQLQAQSLGQGNAGDVIINVTESVVLDGFDQRVIGKNDFGGDIIQFFLSTIVSSVEEMGNGSGGDIHITTGSLSLTNGARISNGTNAQGNAGNVIINARDQVFLDGSASSFASAIFSSVGSDGNGNGGNIDITTRELSLTNEAYLSASTNGRGDAGNISIDATERISLDSDSYIASVVDDTGNGNGGDIRITTGSLFVAGAAQLDSSTFGQGSAGDVIVEARDTVSLTGITDARSSGILSTVEERGIGDGGNIRISTGSLFVNDSARLNASTFGEGNAGDIVIEARDIVSFSGTSPDGSFPSAAFSTVGDTGIGDSGNIRILSRSLTLSDGAVLSSRTAGQGTSGNVIIEASEQVSLKNDAVISSIVDDTGNGDGGDIRIRTGALSVTNGGVLQASTFGQGNAGNVDIEASDQVAFRGIGQSEFPSSILTTVGLTGDGDGGEIRITTGLLSLTNGAQWEASTFGEGDAGDIIITAGDRVLLDRAIIYSTVGNPLAGVGNGDGGDIRITTGLLSVTNGAQLSGSTFGQGDAGDIIIEAVDSVSFAGIRPDSSLDLPSAAFSIVGDAANGDGGNIRISSRSLSVTDGARISGSTFGQGRAGNMQIDASDIVLLDGVNNSTGLVSGLFSSTSEGAGARGGTITVNTDSFGITNGAIVDAQTFGAFRGGDVIINVQSLSLSDRAQISARSQGTGDAGAVNITADEAVTLTNSDITTSAEQAAGGAISITADSLSLNRANITAATGTSGAEGAANITLQGLDLVLMGNESLISANALNNANGGNVAIDSTFVVATPPEGSEGSDITANAFQGNGGRVSINTQGLFGIEFRSERTPDNDITVTSQFGLAGVFEQNTPGVDPSRGLAELPTDVVDASKQIDRRCSLGGTTQERNSFTVTGRGGLPPSPNDTLQGEAVVTNWVSLDSEVEDSTYSSSTTPSRSAQRQLREAQGWVINEKGEVVLTDKAAIVTPQEGGFQGLQCNAPPENAPSS